MGAWYGDNGVSCRVQYEWIEMFKNGHWCRALGCPITATTAQNEEKARELILHNGRVTVNEINISIGSACSVVHDNLQFHKMCAI
jgi:hypothetical protein